MARTAALLCCAAVFTLTAPLCAASVRDNTEELLRHPDPLSLIQVDLGAEIEAEIKAAVENEYHEDYHFDATRISLLDMMDAHEDRVPLKEYALRLNGHGWSLLDLKDTYLHGVKRKLHHEHRLKVAKRRGYQAYESHTLGDSAMRFQTLRGMQQVQGSKLKCGDRSSCDDCLNAQDSKKHCVWRVDTKDGNKQYCDIVSKMKMVPGTTKSYGKAKVGSGMMASTSKVEKETCPTPEDLTALAPPGADGAAGAAAPAAGAPSATAAAPASPSATAAPGGATAADVDPAQVEAEVDAAIGPLAAQADKTVAAEDAEMATSSYDKRMLEVSREVLGFGQK